MTFRFPFSSLFRAFFGIVIVAILLFFIDIDFFVLKNLSVSSVSFLALTSFLILLSVALSFQLALRGLGYSLRFGDSFHLSSLNAALNMFLPFQAGLALRAMYLKKLLKLGYVSYGYIMGVAQGFSWFFALSIVLVLSLVSHYTSLRETSIFMFSGLLCLVCILFFLYFLPNSNFARLISSKLLVDVRKFEFSVMTRSGIVSVAMPTFMAVNMWFVASQLDYDIGFLALLLISFVAHISLFVSFTPGNLGVREGIFVFLGDQLGGSPGQIIMLVLVDRCVFTGVVAIFGWLAFNRLKIPGSKCG